MVRRSFLVPDLAGLALVLASACGSTVSATPGGSSGTSPVEPGNPDGRKENDAGVIIGPDGEVIDAPDVPPPPPPNVTTTAETMMFDGQSRRYVLAVPVDYDAAKTYPLVLSFHGNPGTADGMAAAYPFDSASKKEAIIVYPNALGIDWDLYSATPQNADIRFIPALIDTVAEKVNVDKARVFGVGWSGGGFFINQLACRSGGLLRAISVHAGGAPAEPNMANPPKHPNGFLKCESGAPIATIVFHGDQDTTVEFGSGEFDATYWAYVNGCQSARASTAPPPCEAYNGCPAATPVTFCPIPGGGHGVGATAFATTWDFFKALPP